jgi:acyl-CoA reductase-like NAD-dependent aldehyde dehydrogenase
MKQVDLVMATGGAAMVGAAYSSGTPAYGVGAGNPVIIIAEDADIADSAKKITISKCFDNATSCSSDTSLIIQEGIYNDMVEALKNEGGYLCNEDEKAKLKNWMWIASKKTGQLGLNPAVVAQGAEKIAEAAGLSVPAGTKMLMVECDNPGCDKFSGEKISPVLALWKYSDFTDAMATQVKLTEYAGVGHSCGLYTFNQDYIEKLGETVKSSRLIIRQPHAPACGGNFFNGMPSTVTLGCGTWGGNITTENINWKHFVNITWVSEPFDPVKPTDEEMWGKFWEKYGK